MKFRCKLCGKVFEADSIEDAVCPLCGATGDNLELIEDEPEVAAEETAAVAEAMVDAAEKTNPYAGTRPSRTCGPLSQANPRHVTSTRISRRRRRSRASSRLPTCS